MNQENDPIITTEILRNAFISCAEDMNATLIRSAYSALLYEIRDCSVALLDEHGDVLGQSNGVPLFLGNLEECVKLTANMFGWDVFKPGDIFIMNDSYMTGTHLGDVTIFSPIFYDLTLLIGFVATRAHWADIGGKDPVGPMDSTEIYQEGIRWGPTKVYDGGIPRADIIDLIRRNSRFGYTVIGDMNAQIAACRTGETRFKSIVEFYGHDTIKAARDEIFKQSELMERASVREIPDGIYKAEGFIDNDGQGNVPVPVKVSVQISQDQMTIDLAGSSSQTRGAINCGFAQAISACRVAFKLLVNPERPVNGGSFRNLTVKAPEGSIFRAQEPAACWWYFTPLGLLIDLFITALAPVMPNRVAAAHYGDSMVVHFAGIDPRKGNSRYVSVEANSGGWGGFAKGDGQDALINIVNAGLKDMPVEVFENKYPILVRYYRLRPNSGGPGRYRGGCGITREVELLTDASISTWFDRSVTPAWGLFGGKPGLGPDIVINPGRDSERHFLKVNSLPLKKGDVFRIGTGGGGGFGSPWERDPNLVLNDVIDGYLTVEDAERDYGVVIKEDLSIDKSSTHDHQEMMAKLQSA
jgi:N-methylhydantoinase B